MSTGDNPRCVGIVPTAGAGIRMGAEVKKQYLPLGGEPILAHTLRALHNCAEIDAIILVVPEEDKAFCEEKIVAPYRFDNVISIVAGGKERQDSVYAGLQAIESEPELVVIHDGVRPFLTTQMVKETVQSATQGISASTGVPVSDTTKSVNKEHMVIKTLSRETLWSIQTPQAFPYHSLLTAYEAAFKDGFYGTDDAALIERIGLPVRIVMGSHDNIKITSPSDLAIGESILKQRTIAKEV